MYNTSLTFDYKILENKLSCIIRTDILQYVEAKSTQNLAFVQHFIGL